MCYHDAIKDHLRPICSLNDDSDLSELLFSGDGLWTDSHAATKYSLEVSCQASEVGIVTDPYLDFSDSQRDKAVFVINWTHSISNLLN